jgi:hypothetical protein
VNPEEVAGTRKSHTLLVDVASRGDDERAKIAEEKKTRNQGISKIEETEPKAKDKPNTRREYEKRGKNLIQKKMRIKMKNICREKEWGFYIQHLNFCMIVQ